MTRFREEMAAGEARGSEDVSLESMQSIAVQSWLALQALEQIAKQQQTITA